MVIKKATDSEGGHGVYFVNKKSTKKDIIEIINKIDDDFVVQKVLKQHKVLNEINSSSINTIRIMSIIISGKVEIISSILRMGIKGSRVDNASSGGITCGIKSNGNLLEYAYTSSGIKYSEHPDSKMKFSEITIPNFDKVKELVLSTHLRFPYYRLISWDICMDEKGNPCLIEANLKYGELDFHQLNNGPIFKDKTNEILKEVFKD